MSSPPFSPTAATNAAKPTLAGVRFLFFDEYAKQQRIAYGGSSSYGRRSVVHYDGGKKAPAIWPALLALLQERGLPGREFIRAQFLATRREILVGNGRFDRFVAPTRETLISEDAVENFQKYHRECKSEAEVEIGLGVHNQRMKLLSLRSHYPDLSDELLADLALEESPPMFRFIVRSLTGSVATAISSMPGCFDRFCEARSAINCAWKNRIHEDLIGAADLFDEGISLANIVSQLSEVERGQE